MKKIRKFKISILKQHEDSGNPQADKYFQYGHDFVGVRFFKSPNFHNLNKKSKTRLVKSILEKTRRDKLSQKFEFEEKERVIVNQTGQYGSDKTLFDKEVKMPKHLIDKKPEKRRIK